MVWIGMELITSLLLEESERLTEGLVKSPCGESTEVERLEPGGPVGRLLQ